MYNNLKETFAEIEFHEEKINKLQSILKSKKYTNIQIHFFADGKHNTLYQSDCTFSLENEIKNIIEDTITDLQTLITNIKQQL